MTLPVLGSAQTFTYPCEECNNTFTGTNTFNGPTNLSGPVSNSKISRDCRLDGLAADGVTDDSAALQACFNNAFAAGQGTLLLPSGVIEILTGQNFTNKPGMTFKGTGSQRCRFTGSCGTNYVTLANTTVIDMRTGSVPWGDFTGSGSTTFSDLTLNTCAAGATCASALPGASTLALLFARDASGGGTPYFQFSQWVTLKNVQIQMAPSATANSNFGSIGIYDYGAEQFSTVNSSIYAGTPVWFTLTNATLGITSAYQTISAPASMNGIHLTTTDLWYTSNTGAGFVAEGSIGTVQTDNTVGIHTSPIASALTSPPFLFLGAGTNYNWTIRGQMENQNSTGANGAIINTNHSLDHMNVDVDLAGYSASGSPAGLIQWNGQTGLTLSNSQIRMRNINGTAVPLIQNTANTVSGTLLDLSSTLNPASFSSLTITSDDVWGIGFVDANITFPAGAKYTLHDTTGISVGGGFGLAGSSLTNTVFDTAAAGNVFKINGNTISSNTGSGSVNVLQTSPTLITPNIGVASGTSINLSGSATVGTTLGVTGLATLSGGVSTTSVSASGTVSGSNIPAGTIESGTGTTNTISKFTNGAAGVQGNSGLTDDGTQISTLENVGIGVAVPSANLHVSTSSTNIQRGIISEQTSNDVNGAFVYLQKSRSGGIVVNGDAVGSFSALGNDGSVFQPAARVKFTVDGAVSAGVVPMSVGFFTGSSASGTERLHISSAGVITFPSSTVTLPASSTFTTPVISGGTIDNSVMGGVTPALGTFTTLTITTQFALVHGSLRSTATFAGAVGCTTAGSVGATCTSGALTWSNTLVDTSYFPECTFDGATTNVPVIQSVTKTSATQFTITIAALTAAAATGSVTCLAYHT